MGDNIRNSVRKWGGGGPVLLVPNKLLSKQLNHIPNQRRIAGKKGSESAAMFICCCRTSHTRPLAETQLTFENLL